MQVTHIMQTPDGEIKLSTGKMAMLATGSVLVQKGGTVIHATATVSETESDIDYLPLTVSYVEKMYAAGLISGSRFIKREGRPSDEETIKGRVVDHSLRPLFPKGFRKEVVLVLEVMAFDGKNNPEEISVLAASLASSISGLPFAGPAAGVVVGVTKEGQVVLNPSLDQEEHLIAEYSVSGVKNRLLNIEGWSKEVSEDKMDEMLDRAMERINMLCDLQQEFIAKAAKPAITYTDVTPGSELVEKIDASFHDKLVAALYQESKELRERSGLIAEIVAAFVNEEEGINEMMVQDAITKLEQKIMRKGILENNKRFSGRGLEEIRPLSAEVDILPTVHGSALFSRGLTQCLSIVTLGSTRMAQTVDDMYGENEKFFMHHYKMPGYTTGEAKKYMASPNNREVGHGAIGENALRYVVSDAENFPYTIRVASEIMTSNGSTSMAATCAASMALMAAGVPLKSAVAGIGVGLVVADGAQQDYKLLLDIEGVEDFYGDMDFKVTGTKEGITAIQFETKLQGVRLDIIKQAFRLSQKGRGQVLEVMNSAIPTSRVELASNAPRVKELRIPVDMIGMIIGPGGKNIKALIEEARAHGPGEVDINIEDDGRVLVTAVNQEQMDYVASQIKASTAEPEVGEIYEGIIDKVMNYGAFVDINANLSGLIHVSELAEGFVRDPNDVVKEGDRVKVKLIKFEGGKYSFSIKQASAPVSQETPQAPEAPSKFEQVN